MLLRFAFALLLVLAGCSPLRTFDALVPKDGGVRQVGKAEAYRDGPRGTLDVYAPTAAGPGKPALPVIVFFYGGSWNSGEKESYGFAGQALAAQGFVVAVPDYRLVPEIRFPTFLEDSAAAVRWVRANAARFGGDPDRIVLAGHSAGGYNATMLALDPQWLGDDRRAVRGFASLAGPYDFLPLDTRVTRAAFGEAADLPATQPIAFASRDDPPALLLVGVKDNLVSPSQSVRLAALLSQAGVPVETRRYEDVGHIGIVAALSKPLRGRAPVLRDVADFARRVTARR